MNESAHQRKVGFPRRRDLLCSLGTTTVVLTSGCLDSVQEVFSSPATLGWVAVTNHDPEPQRCEVQIKREDTVVYESSYEIDGKEGQTPGDVLECTWGDEPGPYTLRGRLADGEWAEVAIDQAFDDRSPECLIAEGRLYDPLGELRPEYESDGFVWVIQDWCDRVPTYRGGCPFANS